jgi:hypothetical protein
LVPKCNSSYLFFFFRVIPISYPGISAHDPFAWSNRVEIHLYHGPGTHSFNVAHFVDSIYHEWENQNIAVQTKMTFSLH